MDMGFCGLEDPLPEELIVRGHFENDMNVQRRRSTIQVATPVVEYKNGQPTTLMKAAYASGARPVNTFLNRVRSWLGGVFLARLGAGLSFQAPD